MGNSNTNFINTLEEAIVALNKVKETYEKGSYIEKEAKRQLYFLNKIYTDDSIPPITKVSMFEGEYIRSCNWFLNQINHVKNTDIRSKLDSYIKRHDINISLVGKCVHIPNLHIGGPYIFLNGNFKHIAYDVLTYMHKDFLKNHKICIQDLILIVSSHKHYMNLCTKCPLCKKVSKPTST